ncbi:MAG: type II toxin-antitoxin system tRNA(fMet)-specific endonuclease VapC [Terracidiphilus sp.]
MRYMLDTDIASYIMKGSEPKVLRKLSTIPVGNVSISAITQSELMYGIEISPNSVRDQARIEVFLRHVQVLDYPAEAALHYGSIRAALKQSGRMIGANDLLIAAHARCLGLVLVTNNTREFKRVPELKAENWC